MSQLYGLAFVEYEDEESAARAIAGMNGKKLGNQTLKISYYQRQPKFQPPQYYPTSTMTQPITGSSSESSNIDYKTLFIRKMNKNVSDTPNLTFNLGHGRETYRVSLAARHSCQLPNQEVSARPITWKSTCLVRQQRRCQQG